MTFLNAVIAQYLLYKHYLGPNHQLTTCIEANTARLYFSTSKDVTDEVKVTVE